MQGQENLAITPESKFKNPTEEVSFLRERLGKLESEITSGEREPLGESPAEGIIRAYSQTPREELLQESAILPDKEIEGIHLNIPPEKHDAQMGNLLAILEKNGIRNAIHVAQKLNNPHIEDDFHRFLAEYIKEGYRVVGLKEKQPLYKALNMTLYEVSLPEVDKDDEKNELKRFISSMEQFYAGMQAVAGDAKNPRHFTVEIAQSNEREDIVFYVSVPTENKHTFEKQILATFSNAHIAEHNADYNIFNEEGETVGSVANLSANDVFPIKTYEKFDIDPLNVVLNVFSKLSKVGEGASVQLLLKPAGKLPSEKFAKILDKVQQGTPVKDAIGKSIGKELGSAFGDVAKELFFGQNKKKDGFDPKKEKKVDEIAKERIKAKIESPLFSANLRLLASSSSKERATAILSEIESAFHQFEEGGSNKLTFDRKKNSKLKELAHNFSFRIFDDSEKMILNTKELTTLVHFPSAVIKGTDQLKKAKANTAPAPIEMPQDGVLLGVNVYRGSEKEIHFPKEDRLRHFYCIGQTGTGKTTILKNMIVQDIKNGEGVCMIDPHGSDIVDILSNVPQERADDVIYFDPAYTPRPMGLNMLEYDARYPEQKSFVVDELLSIFNKLFDMKTAGGPMFEQYFRNSALLVMDSPESGNTLIDLSRVLADKKYRDEKLRKAKNPIVVQFWREIAEKAGGEASLSNIVPYITSKFDVFLTNEIMRPVIAQEKSSFNFREIMDNRKILLVNLSKGRLGDINANLIGLILVGKILMAALSRVDSLGKGLPPFYLYIDEFQNITTDSISSILSEARKYGLSLNIAHQFIKQLDEKIKDSVFGNVGSICAFRVSSEDAEYLEKQFDPPFSANDLMNIDNWNAYLKLLVNGRPEKPFSIKTLSPDSGNKNIIEPLKNMSYERYGRDRNEVEKEIMRRYDSRGLEDRS